MPRVNMYIRKDDYKDFKSIKDKPDWLHYAIESHAHPIMIAYSGNVPPHIINQTKPLKKPYKPSKPLKES